MQKLNVKELSVTELKKVIQILFDRMKIKVMVEHRPEGNIFMLVDFDYPDKSGPDGSGK